MYRGFLDFSRTHPSAKKHGLSPPLLTFFPSLSAQPWRRRPSSASLPFLPRQRQGDRRWCSAAAASSLLRLGGQRRPWGKAGALLLVLSPRALGTVDGRRWPPASLAPSAASSIYSVCIHVLQVLQETLAVWARGRGGLASTQSPAVVPFSSVDALAGGSSGGYQVVAPLSIVWAIR
jgi:hypothetical protein